ncbi:MAG TPA: hypothetical protein VFK02_04840 [Kofleriaceae bacterium]|nr:hypothetical protein [Kofleriaceae bacterium]
MSATDMTIPVTRGELRAELAQLDRRFEDRLDRMLDEKLGPRLAHLATKVELEMWGGALLARIEASEKRLLDELDKRIGRSENRLLDELARHARANHEDLLRHMTAFDDKYADLPRRVSRLEAKAVPRKRS